MSNLEIKENAVFVIDGTNLMHRHFYAKPDLTSSDGTPTGAIYGTIKMLKRYAKDFKPQQMYVCFDKHKKCFRNRIYPEYKGNRKPTDERLKKQFSLFQEFCSLANIPFVEIDGYEADDLIGSLSIKAKEYGFCPYVVSGDKDLYQLINKNIEIIYLSNKGPILFNADKFSEQYDGLKPEQFLDFKALQGDGGDNIPGVPGIGEKTAIKLLKSFGSLDGIYDNLGQLKGKQKENLESSKDIAYRARELATIKCDIDMDYNDFFENSIEESYDFENSEVHNFLNRLDIKSI